MKKVIIKNKNMNLNIDNKIIESFEKNDIKVFFYNSGCEGTKVNLTSDFSKDGLENVEISGKNIYFTKEDGINLDGGRIVLKIEKSDNGHGGKNKYLFVSEKVKSRCGCSSSFSFENKLIDSNKLKQLKKVFNK